MIADRPTKQQIIEWLEERRSFYSTMHFDMIIDQDFIHAGTIFGSSPIAKYIDGFPKGFKFRILPIAKMAVDVGVNQIMVGETPDIQVTLPPSAHRDDAKTKEHVERIRSWCKEHAHFTDDLSTEAPLRDFIAKGLGLGLGTLSYTFLWDRWPKIDDEDYEDKARRVFPWDIRSVHPVNLFIDPYNEPPLDYIEEDEVAVRSIKDRDLRDAINQRGGRQARAVKRVTYVSKDWYAVYVDGLPVFTDKDGADEDGVAPNPSGILWYKSAWGGFGDLHHQGLPEYRGKGIIRDGRDLILLYITNVNLMDVIKKASAMATYKAKSSSVEEAQRVFKDAVLGPLEIIPMGPGDDLVPLESAPIPPAVFQQQDELKPMLEAFFGPDILKGVFRDDTARGQAQRLSQAKAIYRALKQAGEQAYAAMYSDILYFIKHVLKEPLPAGPLSTNVLAPDDIIDGLSITVDFSPPTDEERAFKLQDGLAKLQAGGIELERFISEYEQIEDPQEVIIGILQDQIRAHPAMQDFLVKATIQGLSAALGIAPEQPPAPTGAPGGPGQPPAESPFPGELLPPPALGGAEEVAQQVGAYFNPPPVRR